MAHPVSGPNRANYRIVPITELTPCTKHSVGDFVFRTNMCQMLDCANHGSPNYGGSTVHHDFFYDNTFNHPCILFWSFSNGTEDIDGFTVRKATMKAAEMKNTAAMGYRGLATFMDIKQLNNIYCSSMGSPQSYEVNEF